MTLVAGTSVVAETFSCPVLAVALTAQRERVLAVCREWSSFPAGYSRSAFIADITEAVTPEEFPPCA